MKLHPARRQTRRPLSGAGPADWRTESENTGLADTSGTNRDKTNKER